MIIIRLMGGLGNQMFQYAFGRSLAIKYNTELVLDQSLLLDKSSSHEINTHRDFDLDIFKNLKFRKATPQEVFIFNGNARAGIIKKIARKIITTFGNKHLIVQNHNNIKPEYFTFKGDVCLVGRWQSYKFFNEHASEIRKDFTIEITPNADIHLMEQKIEESVSVCIHVRRGDLVTSPLYSRTIGAMEMDYYETAIDQIKKQIQQPVYFIFSDDIEWCKKNIKLSSSCFFIDNNLAGKKAEGHLYLMSKCKHFIISNSTFAWWGAWLSVNKKKTVMYPKHWYKDSSLSNPEMCPPEWIAI